MIKKTKILTTLLFASAVINFTGCNATDGGDNNTTNNTNLDDNLPKITLEGDIEIKIPLGTKSVLDAGDKFSAYDKQDGDLTNSVVRTNDIDFSKAGTYYITYTVTDSDGFKDVKKRIVSITGSDAQPYTGGTTYTGSVPVISFSDGDTLFLNVGEHYNPNTYSATDFEDGDITQYVQVEGDLTATQLNTQGVYSVYYSVVDSDKNSVTKERTIYVGYSNAGYELGSSDIENFKSWYSQTCGQTFNDSFYNENTGQYNGAIDCSNSGLIDIDLTNLSIFTTIKSLDLSNNSLTDIDFNQLDLSVNNVKVLEDLDISYNQLSDKSMFDPLHNLKNINNLWIQGNNFDYSRRADREALYETLNNKSLTIFF